MAVGLATDDDDGYVSLLSEACGLSNLVVAIDDGCTTEPDSRIDVHDGLIFVPVRWPTNIDVFDKNVVRNSCLEIDDAPLLSGPDSKECRSTVLPRPVVYSQFSIDV